MSAIMQMIQARNTLSRGLTGEEYQKYTRVVKKNGKVVKHHSDWSVEPVGCFDDDTLIFCVYNDDVPGKNGMWIEEKRALNCGGYVLICRTKFFVSPYSFKEIKRYVKY